MGFLRRMAGTWALLFQVGLYLIASVAGLVCEREASHGSAFTSLSVSTRMILLLHHLHSSRSLLELAICYATDHQSLFCASRREWSTANIEADARHYHYVQLLRR